MDWDFEPSARRRTCMLIVTHTCNLNCSYCYETHKKNAYMDVNSAKEIILREAQFVNDSDQFDELQIDFMGGEPLMNFPLIKEIVEWLESGVISVPWICSKLGYENTKTVSPLARATTETAKCSLSIAALINIS